MTKGSKADWPDEQIIASIRKWAVAREQCGLDVEKANRISEQELFPLEAVLSRRGPASLRKLLPLTEDENAEARLVAASFAYATDPSTCSRTLARLMRRRDRIGVLALLLLAEKDRKFASEFESLAALGHERCEEEMTRRYGPRW